jgi:hypothetical protein
MIRSADSAFVNKTIGRVRRRTSRNARSRILAVWLGFEQDAIGSE